MKPQEPSHLPDNTSVNQPEPMLSPKQKITAIVHTQGTVVEHDEQSKQTQWQDTESTTNGQTAQNDIPQENVSAHAEVSEDSENFVDAESYFGTESTEDSTGPVKTPLCVPPDRKNKRIRKQKAKKMIRPRLDAIATVVIFAALFFKFFYFYSQVIYKTLENTTISAFFLTLISLFFFAVGCIIVRLIRPKRPNHIPFLIIVTCIMTALMLIDAAYKSYFNMLPSVLELKKTGELGESADSVLAVIQQAKYDLIALGWDIVPLIIFGSVVRPLLMKRPKRPQKKASKRNITIGMSVVALVTLIAVSLMLLLSPMVSAVTLRSELLCYHIGDFYTALFGDSQNSDETLLEDSMDWIANKDNTKSTTEKNDMYWGIGHGKNVLVIQVEALQNFVLNATYNGQVLTPNLNAFLKDDCLQFTNHYYQVGGGNTADAEFTVNNSLYPPEKEAAYEKYTDNDYYGLPFLLKDNGYTGAYAYHGNNGAFWNRETAYPYQGFDDFISREDMPSLPTMGSMEGVTDSALFERIVYDMQYTYTSPYYIFAVTISSHHPFEIPAEMATLRLKDEDVGTLGGNYLQSVHYFDQCFGELVQNMKQAGLWDDTIIVLYGDHMALPCYTEEYVTFMEQNFMPKDVSYNYVEHFRVPFLMRVPGFGSETHSIANGHIDIAPTLLHILGISNDRSIMLGQDLFVADEGIVLEQTHLGRGSYFTDNILLMNFQQDDPALITVLNINGKTQLSRSPTVSEYKTCLKAKRIFNMNMYLLDNDLILTENIEVLQKAKTSEK